MIYMANGLPDELIDQIRNENDIVEVIGEYVQLKKQGKNYFGLCPFHDEKSPSFSVVKEKQFFHCFGCGKSGNVFNFLMEKETFTFIEAVQFLAERVHISLPEAPTKRSSMSEEQTANLEAHDWLTKFYHHLLKYAEDGKEALSYLKDRSISDETIQQFQLGFAPADSKFTTEFLEEKGFHLQFLVKAGLLSTSDNVHFNDIFRNRVIFPIKNHLGKTVAFGGRAIHGEQPKYLNSKEHELFHKGQLFYNFDLAKNHIRKQNSVIIFEGYMDVIQAYQAGIKNGVATLGTALSESQVKLIKRYVNQVTLCYDSDDAGLKAAYESAVMFQRNGTNVRIATMRDGLDPDDYIRQYGGEAFQRDVLDVSDTFMKFYMTYKRKDFNLAVDSERITYVEHITKALATVESPIEREYYVKELADEFNLSTDIIHHDINTHKNRMKRNNMDNVNNYSDTTVTAPVRQRTLRAHIRAERQLIALMFHHPYIVSKVQQELGVQFTQEAHRVILTHVYGLFEEYGEVSVSELFDKISDEHIKQLLTEIAMIEVNDAISDAELNDYIMTIQKEVSNGDYLRSLKRKQKEEKDPILAAKIGLEILNIQKQLKM